MAACWQRHSAVVSMLLQAGAYIESSNEYGETALWFACVKGHADEVKSSFL
eukprot:gene14334-4217_t